MTGAGSPITVLHVDDEPDFADLAATYLEQEVDRFTVHTTTNTDDALDLIADPDLDIDCIISDYDMPDRNGIEFLESIRENHPSLPFILFTGKGSEEVASDAFLAGATDYLQKESGSDQYTVLANRIINAVDQHRAEVARQETEQRLIELTDRSPDVLWMFSADWNNLLFINTAYEDVYGQPESVLDSDPRKFLDAIHPEDRAKAQEAMARMSAGESVELEYRVNEAADYQRWVWVQGTPITNDDGEVIRLAGFSREITTRKEREQELERYETIVETAGDPVYTLDTDGHFTFVNDALLDVTGYDKDSLLGEHASRVMPTEDVKRGEELIRSLLTTDEDRATFEMDLITATGTHIPCENHLGLLPFDDDDSLEGTVGVLRDITDQRAREQELERYREYTDRIFDGIDDLLFIQDRDGTLHHWNDSLTTVTGYTNADVASMTATEFIAETDRQQMSDALQDVFESGHAKLEASLHTADGTTIPYEFAADRVEHPDGSEYLVCVGRNISARRDHQRELEAVQHRMEFALETTDAIVWDWNVDDDNVIFHPSEQSLYGTTIDSWEDFIEMVHPDDRREVRDAIDKALGNGEPKYEVVRFIRDGEVRLMETTGHPVVNADGATHMIGVARDITEQVRNERALERKDEHLTEFANILTHDLRNPLSVIGANLELAQAECDSDHLAPIQGAVDRMNALIDDVLALAEHGELVTDAESISLPALIEDSWATVETADATLVTQVNRSVHADRSRLKQVFENMIRNAVEHGGKTVTVTIGGLEDGFYIEDDGPGIFEGDLEHVFDAGYSTAIGGTGFGLSIAERVIEAHGWQIHATNGKDGGARFEITGVEFTD